MDPAKLAVVADIGKRLLSTKLFSISMYWLWIYDYFLTLGDEINYAWSGSRSWMFALFIANRYIPMLQVIYKGTMAFHFTKSLYVSTHSTVHVPTDPDPSPQPDSCRNSVWEVMVYTTVVLVLSQITMCVRVYAVTGRNRFLCGALCVLASAQLGFGVYHTVMYSVLPLQSLPEIDLDAYRVCIPPKFRPGEVTFTSISLVFDLFVFLIILVTARGPRTSRFPGIPSILDAILRDATVYFLLIVASQLVLFFFVFLAPPQNRLMPGLTHATFLPIMTSRLMLSLNEATIEPTGLCFLSTTSDFARGWFTEGGTLSFATQGSDVSLRILGARLPPNKEDGELDSVPQLPRDRGSRQLRQFQPSTPGHLVYSSV